MTVMGVEAGGVNGSDAATVDDLDISAERRHEAQITLRAAMNFMVRDPFRGCFVVDEDMPVLLAGLGVEDTMRHYGEALVEAWKAWGADVQIGPFGVGESLMVSAQMDEAGAGDKAKQDGMIEACAEVIRVLVCGAIITARSDCKPGDAVLVRLRSAPEFNVGALDDGGCLVLSRVRVAVVCDAEPRFSYLLGSRDGDRAYQLTWGIPLLDCFYGPNRMRWMDLRSPGHLEREQLVKASPRVLS